MTTLSQTFCQSAADAREAFPERLESLVVLVTSSEEPVYVSPDIVDHLSKKVTAVKGAVNLVTRLLQRNNAIGLTDHDYSLAGYTVKLIAMNEDFGGGIYSPRYTKEIFNTCVFDHEIGHLVVKNGYVPGHLGECAADAYAALRHVQRFGVETDFFEYFNRADTIVRGGSPIHYTDAVVQKIKQLSKEMDISKLSLRKTAQLAGEIASQHKISEETLKKIAIAFAPVRFKGSGTDDKAIYRKTLSVMKQHQNDPDILAAGKRFLSHPARKKFMEELAKTDTEWKEALDFLAKSEKENTVEKNKRGISPA